MHLGQGAEGSREHRVFDLVLGDRVSGPPVNRSIQMTYQALQHFFGRGAGGLRSLSLVLRGPSGRSQTVSSLKHLKHEDIPGTSTHLAREVDTVNVYESQRAAGCIRTSPPMAPDARRCCTLMLLQHSREE